MDDRKFQTNRRDDRYHGLEDESGGSVIYGRNAVTEAIKSGGGIEKLLLQKNVEGEAKRIFAMAKKARIPVQAVPKFVLDKETGGAAHQGVAAFVTDYVYSDVESILAEAKVRGEAPFVVVLDGIEDPHNLGAIIRSAEGAGVHGVIIPRQRAASVNGTVMKTSAGAAAYMKVAKVGGVKAALDELKEKGLWIYGLDMAGASYRGQDFDGGVCLVIGAEGSGLSRIVREACDFLVSIPMHGRMESLNASAAAAVVLFEIAGRGGDSRLRVNDSGGVDSPSLRLGQAPVKPANDVGGAGNDGGVDSPSLRLGQAPGNVGFAHSSGRDAPCAVRFANQIRDLGQKGKSANDGEA